MLEEPTPVARDRVAFTAGLLVILISLAPALEWLRDRSTPFLGDEFRLSYGYYIVATVLAASLYCYAASVASTRRSQGLHMWGDRFYASAVLAIPAFIVTYIVGVVQFTLFPDQAAAETAVRIILLLLLPAIVWRIGPIVRALEKVDAARRQRAGQVQSGTEMAKALDLHKLGFHDMAIVAATNSMISLAESSMPVKAKGVRSVLEVYKWLQAQLSEKIPQVGEKLQIIRDARNAAAHGRLIAAPEQSLRIIRDCNLIANHLTLIPEDSD